MSTETTTSFKPIYTNETRFTGPFTCYAPGCDHLVRPPKTRADAPGMEGTQSYGGRGLCTGCYRLIPAEDKARRQARPEAPSVVREYHQQALNSFMSRRRNRLTAGSVAVPEAAARAARVAIAGRARTEPLDVIASSAGRRRVNA